MVAKFRYEVSEGVDDHEPARVLYTGTTVSYFADTFRREGEFRHKANPVFLSEDLWIPCSYAVKRSRFYGDSPLLLIVDAQKLESELQYDGIYRTDALNMGSFLPYQISPDPRGKLTVQDYNQIIRMSHQIPGIPESELAREVEEFLKIKP